jgi:type IV fimbrial biogenesis protein FimT
VTKGATLFELLIVMAIFSVLAGMAFVSYPSVITQLRVNALKHQLIQSLQLARFSALSAGVRVMILPANDPQEKHWDQGWKLVALEESTGEKYMIQETVNKHKNITIQLAAFPSNENLQWEAEGILQQNNGHFTIAAKNNENIREHIIINKTGRIR